MVGVQSAERIAAAEKDKEACALAAHYGLYFVYSKAVFMAGAKQRTAHYSIRRGSFKVGDFWPSTGTVQIGGRRHPDGAESLADAIRLIGESSALADAAAGKTTQPTPKKVPVKQVKPQRRKTQRPKNPFHMAKGRRLGKIKPALILSREDWQRIESVLADAAVIEERTEPNMVSIYRELLERISDAHEDGANVVIPPPLPEVEIPVLPRGSSAAGFNTSFVLPDGTVCL